MDSWEIWRKNHAWDRKPIEGSAREIFHTHLGIIPVTSSDNANDLQAIQPQELITNIKSFTNTQDNLPEPKADKLEAEILKLEAKLQEMEEEWSEFLDPFFLEPEPKQKPEKPRYVPKPTGARPETLENLERWHLEIKRLFGTSRKFKYHTEICRHIASLSGETAKYEHIRKQTRDYFRQLKPKENNLAK